MHKILGQVDILGSPILLGSSLITGVTSFFYEPAKGAQLGPEEFAKGLGKGAAVGALPHNTVSFEQLCPCNTVSFEQLCFFLQSTASLSLNDVFGGIVYCIYFYLFVCSLTVVYIR